MLGAEDRPQWDNVAIASQYRLRTRFPARVLRETATFREPGAQERRGRLDLRDRLTFTIDPADAKDHDDALSVIPDGSGYEVGIHIADVSHYVKPGSGLDAEAVARGTSTYLPGDVVPMLPERLSSDLCSLRPDRDRLAISVLARLDAESRLKEVRFAETVIRSRHRLSYEEVQEGMDGRRTMERPLEEALAHLRHLARALRERRRAAGALELEIPEVRAWIDASGVPLKIERRAHLESHELIEEFMLLANRCVGEEGARRSAGLLYRVHEPPAERKLAELDRVLRALGLPHAPAGIDSARALQRLLAVPLDSARRRLLHRMVLRALSRARYAAHDLGHFGLATREYCHFTSPIRRYPDLHNHARVREWIRGRRTAAWDPEVLDRLAWQCSAAEQTSADAEREATRVKSLRMVEGRLGDRASGMITGLVPQGLFVELDEIPVEGFVRVSQDLDDHFVLDASGVRMVGRRTRRRFVMGDPVEVVVARVDIPGRECDLALHVPQRRSRRRRHGRS